MDTSRISETVAAATNRQLKFRVLRFLGIPAANAASGQWSAAPWLTAAAVLWGLAGMDHEASRVMADQANEGVYDHFFYLRHNPDQSGTAKTDSLMQVRVTPNGFDQRVVYSKNNLHIGWEPLLATGGKFYGLSSNRLVCIDLGNGKAEELDDRIGVHGLADERLYARIGDSLHIFDLVHRVYRNAGQIGSYNQYQGGASAELSISSDRKFVSFFARLPDLLREGRMSPGFKLHLVDIETGNVKIVGPEIPAITYLTGGGTSDEGPPYVWLDPTTIVVVREEANRIELAFSNKIGLKPGAESTVCQLKIATEQFTDIVALPRWNRTLGEPYFRGMLSDGVPRIVLGETGQYRIDLKTKSLIEDDVARGDYRFSPGKPPQRIIFGETNLAEAERIQPFSAAPDGGRVVWLIRTSSEATSLFYHDSVEGHVRSVASGWLPNSWSRIHSEQRSIVWARSKDLEPAAERFLDGWKAIPATTFPAPPPPRDPDPRPLATDLIEYKISTDKPVYEICEPVELTVTLTNKSDRELSFPAPRGYGSFFGVGMKHPKFGMLIPDFDNLDQVFPADPVVIAPGKSFHCTRNFEPDNTGTHKLSAELSQGMIPWGGLLIPWRGRVKAAPVEFNVEASPDGPTHFIAKYKRQMARCRAEFNQDPSTCDSLRIYNMGPGVAPLLIEELTSSNDATFRQRMSIALVLLGTPEALPYFESLLKGDLKEDREMVLAGFVILIERKIAVDRALALLISATKHSNVEVRRDAVARLAKLKDSNIKEALEAAVSDIDIQVAHRAARHLAALEHLDLADWFTAAIDEPTEARYLAAKSIVADLERTWRETKGVLPDVSWSKAVGDQKVMEAYRQTLRNWLEFANRNPRESSHFFDDDLKPRDYIQK